MDKRVRLLLIVGALAVAAYLGYRWMKSRQAGNASPDSPTGGLGTNLNSVAPELVGGSTGPAVGPALSTPINITLTEQVAPAPEDRAGTMTGVNTSSTNALKAQNANAKTSGSQPVATEKMGDDIGGSAGTVGPAEPVTPKSKPKSGIAAPRRVTEVPPVQRTHTPMDVD